MTTEMIAGLFPGQGSQAVGMGQALCERESIVRETFAEADATLGFPLSTICFSGPAEELKRTSIAQPALVTMSTAYWRLLVSRGCSCEVAAGHSLGEYSALVAASALDFAVAVQLVHLRGTLMEEAAAAQPGGMAAIIGMPAPEVLALCARITAEYGPLAPANYNAPDQIVVSGTASAITAVRTAVKEYGARAIPLAVSGPFHSPLMQSAADAFAIILQQTPIAPPRIPIIPNVLATPTTDPAVIRDALAHQISGSVRWAETMLAMHAMGITQYLEIGPGNVLTGLAARTLTAPYAITVTDLLKAPTA